MSSTPQESPPPRHPDLTLRDLTDALLWPRLFDAGRLALRPVRLFFGLLTVVAIGLIGSMSLLWGDEPSFGHALGALVNAGVSTIGAWLSDLSLARPWDLHLTELSTNVAAFGQEASTFATQSFPVSVFVLGIPMLVAALVGWAAIARLAAWEFGIGVTEASPKVLAVALARMPSLLGAVLGLPMLVGAVALGMGVAGWLLMALPVLNMLGAVLFGVSMLMALVLTPLLVAWGVGFPLLAPATMCEGPDAFEALQRAMAYVIGHPLRYLIYVVTLIALGAALFSVLLILLAGADALASGATGMFLSGPDADLVSGVASEEHAGTAIAAARIIAFWKATFSLILGAFTVSYFGSASAVLYLLLRKLNDGQDPGDLSAEIAS